MNFTPTNTTRWFTRGSLALVGATLLGAAASADPNEHPLLEEPANLPTPSVQPAGLAGLREALQGGNFWLTVRYRYEDVDESVNFVKDASASTLQTRLGYQTADWRGFSGVLEFADVVNVGGGDRTYNDGTGPATNRPIVTDPVGAQVNQAYLNYSGALGGDLRIGRQRIQLDNQRHVGNIGFRQTEQNYDAITFDRKWDAGLRVFYSYIDNINNILLQNEDSDSHIVNVSNKWDNIGTLSLFGYYVDFDDTTTKSVFTYGGRFDGDRNMGDWNALYGVELAHQIEAGNNPNDVDASYSHVHLGGGIQGAELKVGFESLDGDNSGNAAQAFQTPLATKHAFNGWADKFLVTPGTGLEDTYFSLSYKNSGFAIGAIYHIFDAETGVNNDYGDEFDVYASIELAEDLEFGATIADFDADSNPTNTLTNTTKFWVWLAYSF